MKGIKGAWPLGRKVCQIRVLGQENKGQQDQGIHDVITHATPTVIHQRLADIGTAQVTASAPIGILAATSHCVTNQQQAPGVISSHFTAPASIVYKDASCLKIPQQIWDGRVSQNENFDPLNQVPNSFVSAVSPFAVHLPKKVQDKIYNNKFVNYGTLLFYDPTSKQKMTLFLRTRYFKVILNTKSKLFETDLNG